MRRIVLVPASFCLAAIASPRAQTPQTQPQPVFRGGVDLVTLDVTVIDKDGKPVRGLKPEDFVVTLEKQPRPVRVLDFLEFGSAAGSTAEARQTTNQPGQAQTARRGGRIIVILFDDLSYKPGPGKALLVAAERMIGTFDIDDLIGVTTTSGLGPTVNPTRDRAAVLAALHDKKMIGRNNDLTAPFYIAVDEAIDIDRGMPRETLDLVAARECPEIGVPVNCCTPMVGNAGRAYAQQVTHSTAMQLAAFQQLMGLLKTAPSPKVVIALSAGVAIGTELDLLRQLSPLGRAAAESGVQFYALSELGDDVDLSERTQGRAAARRQESRFLELGRTDRRRERRRHRVPGRWPGGSILQAHRSRDVGFYRLGVEAPVLTDKRRYLATKVSVKASGATVRVNREALLASVAPEAVPIAEQLKTTLGARRRRVWRADRARHRATARSQQQRAPARRQRPGAFERAGAARRDVRPRQRGRRDERGTPGCTGDEPRRGLSARISRADSHLASTACGSSWPMPKATSERRARHHGRARALQLVLGE